MRCVKAWLRSIGVMLRPSRPLPRVGTRARIAHFSGEFEHGTVLSVEEDGRRLQVRGDGGELFDFHLSSATARFVADARGQGPRLELLDSAA